MGCSMRSPVLRVVLAVLCSAVLVASSCGFEPGITATVVDRATGERLGAVTLHIVAKYSDGREPGVFAGVVAGGQVSAYVQARDLATPGPGFAGYEAIFERRGYVPARVFMGATARQAHDFKFNDTVVELVRE